MAALATSSAAAVALAVAARLLGTAATSLEAARRRLTAGAEVLAGHAPPEVPTTDPAASIGT